MKNIHARLLVLFAALLAVMPLIIHGTTCGHDYPFHLTNWMEVQRQWKSGVLLPRWSFRAAWGAGEPRFLFYPPLSWMLGSLLGTVLPWVAVPITFTWAALALSGLSMLSLARQYVRVEVALASAVLYLANPYMLFTAYERTAYGELLAAAAMPWLLREGFHDDVKAWRLAPPVAILWLCNAPAGVIGGYTLLLIAIARVAALLFSRIDDRWPVIRTLLLHGVGGVTLGLALAAFYLVPAVEERPLVEVQMAVIEGMRPWDNFLFHTGPDVFRNAVIRTASITALAVLLTGMVFAVAAMVTYSFRKRDARLASPIRATNVVVRTLAFLLVVFTFLGTPASTFIWRHAPQLEFLQFPWRFVSIAGTVSAFAFALIFLGSRRASAAFGSIAVACVLCAASVMYANTHFRQYCAQKDTVAALKTSVDNGEGDWPTDEYTPKPADNDMLARDNPPYWLASSAGATAVHDHLADVVQVRTNSPYRSLYYVPADRGKFLVLNHRWFRGWALRLNGNSVPPAEMRDDGLTAIALPAGTTAEIELSYHWTVDQWAGLTLSLAALAVLLFIRERDLVAAREAVRGSA